MMSMKGVDYLLESVFVRLSGIRKMTGITINQR